jgi:hypothetical protein
LKAERFGDFCGSEGDIRVTLFPTVACPSPGSSGHIVPFDALVTCISDTC